MTAAVQLKVSPAAHTPATLRTLEHLIRREIQRIKRAADTAPQDWERDGDEIDMATTFAARAADAATQRRFANSIGEWTAALRRLTETPDTFGTCRSCGDLIPAERLEILPTVQLCITCH